MDYTDVDNLFRSLRRKTGIYITPDMFRHTSLSMLNSAGWSPELLRVRAGHKNIYTTLNTYVHPSDDEVSEAFRKVSDKLAMPGKDGELMGALAIEKVSDPHYEEMISYLSTENGYWLKNDKWSADSEEYKSLNLGPIREEKHFIADFTGYKNETVKIEVKYAILLLMKEKTLSAYALNNVYSTAVKLVGTTLGSDFSISTLAFINAEDTAELKAIVPAIKPLLKDKYDYLKRHIIKIITELY